MAIGGIIGSIRVALGLDTAQFQNGAKEMQGTLGGIGRALKGFAAGLGAALSFGALVKAMQSAIDHADELGKSAQKIGLPVEALSKLEYAARLADVELGGLTVGVGKLSQALAAAAGGTSNDATKALAAIGVAAVDSQGNLRPTEAVIYDVAEAFSKMEDGAGKTALAMAIFGRSGKDLIPLLNEGASGLKESADEAERFGVVVDTKTAKAAEQFNDNLTRLKAAMEGLTNKAMVAIIDQMVVLTNQFVEFAKSDAADKFLENFNTRLETTIREAKALAGVLDFIVNGSEGFQKMVADSQKKSFASRLDSPLNLNIHADEKSLEDLKKSIDELYKPKPALVPAPIVKKEDTEAVRAADKALKDLKRSADSVWEDTRTPLEQYQIQIRNLNDLLQQGQIDHDTYARAVKMAQDAFAETGDEIETLGSKFSEVFQDKLGGIFDDLLKGSFDLFDTLQDIGGQLTKLAANKALELLFNGTGNPTQGGGLSGLFKSLLGFASGGTIFPGGSGGQDSQLVAFRKSPNERVDITKPGQQLHSGGVQIKSTVNNYTTAQVEQRHDDEGNLITEVRSVMKGLVGDGSFDKPFNTRYGQKPLGNQRT